MNYKAVLAYFKREKENQELLDFLSNPTYEKEIQKEYKRLNRATTDLSIETKHQLKNVCMVFDGTEKFQSNLINAGFNVASKHGHVNIFDAMLTKFPFLINTMDTDLLSTICIHGHGQIFDKILQPLSDYTNTLENIKNILCKSIVVSSENGQVEILQTSLEYIQANQIDLQQEVYLDSLSRACDGKHNEVVSKLLEFSKQDDMNVTGLSYEIFLLSASQSGSVDIFEMLLKRSRVQNQWFKTVSMNTCLGTTFLEGHQDLFKKFLAQIDNEEQLSFDVVTIANSLWVEDRVSKNHTKDDENMFDELVNILVNELDRNRVDSDDKNIIIHSFIHHASIKGYQKGFQTLLALFKDSEMEGPYNFEHDTVHFIVRAAVENGHKDILETILEVVESDESIKLSYENVSWAIRFAVENGMNDILEILYRGVAQDENIIHTNEGIRYSFEKAVVLGHNDIVATSIALVERGDALSFTNEDINTGFLTAVRYGFKDIVETIIDLVERDKTLNLSKETLDQAFKNAVKNKDSTTLKRIIRLMENEESLRHFDDTVTKGFLFAVVEGDKDKVELINTFVNKYEDLKITNSTTERSIMLSIRERHIDVFERLIDWSEQEVDYDKLIDMLIEEGAMENISYLLRKGSISDNKKLNDKVNEWFLHIYYKNYTTIPTDILIDSLISLIQENNHLSFDEKNSKELLVKFSEWGLERGVHFVLNEFIQKQESFKKTETMFLPERGADLKHNVSEQLYGDVSTIMMDVLKQAITHDDFKTIDLIMSNVDLFCIDHVNNQSLNDTVNESLLNICSTNYTTTPTDILIDTLTSLIQENKILSFDEKNSKELLVKFSKGGFERGVHFVLNEFIQKQETFKKIETMFLPEQGAELKHNVSEQLYGDVSTIMMDVLEQASNHDDSKTIHLIMSNVDLFCIDDVNNEILNKIIVQECRNNQVENVKLLHKFMLDDNNSSTLTFPKEVHHFLGHYQSNTPNRSRRSALKMYWELSPRTNDKAKDVSDRFNNL